MTPPNDIFNISQLQIMFDVISCEKFSTELRRVYEGSADSIENSVGFHLSSVGGIVDDDRWEQVWSIFAPIFNILVNKWVSYSVIDPVGLVWNDPAANDAIHCLFPAEAYFFMTITRAIFIDSFFTFSMYFSDVVKEFLFLTPILVRISLFVYAHLPQILHNNLLSCQFGSWVSTVVSLWEAVVG